MDPRTVELLRALQGQEHDAAAFERITTLYKEEREALCAIDDLGMLSHLGELLEGWAADAGDELGSRALTLAARTAEDDLQQPERAIALLERVLDLEPTPDAIEQLAGLYVKRGGPEDPQQAADLYAALGDTLGDEGRPYLERAIELVPWHEAAIAMSRLFATDGKFRDALVCISPLAERGHADAKRLHEAYLANLEGAVPAKKSRRGESLPPPQVQRPARSGGTMVGFRLDQYHEALKQEEEQVAQPGAVPADSGGDGPSEDSVVRALPQKPELEKTKPIAKAPPAKLPPPKSPLPAAPEAAAATVAAAPAATAPAAAAPAASAPAAQPVVSDPSKTMMGIGKPLNAPKPAATQPVARGAAPARADAGKTMMGIGIPAHLAQSIAAAAAPFSAQGAGETPAGSAPAASPIVARDPKTASMPTTIATPSASQTQNGAPAQSGAAAASDAGKTMMGIGIPASLLQKASAPTPSPAPIEAAPPPAAAAPDSSDATVAPVVRRSLPPPNPKLVRASRPSAARTSRPALRSSSSGSLAAATPQSASVAEPQASLFTSEPIAEPQPEPVAAMPEPAPIEPFTVAATPRESFAPKKQPLPIKWIAGGVAALVAIGAVFAMSGGDEPTAPAASATDTRVSQQVATATAAPSAAAPTPAAAPAPAAPAPAAPAAVAPAAAEPTAVAPAAPAPEAERAAPKRAKPKGKIKVAAKEIKVKGGKISGTQIMVALEDALPKIESCYHEALEKKPRLSGKVTLGFSIQKTGKLAGARVAKSTLKNKPFESCAVDALDGQRFPKIKKPATVTLPIGLTP
jgi:hypothetical protein